MLIVSLGDHDMILGCKWFVQTGVLIDCKNRRLLWPEDQPRTGNWSKTLIATKEVLEPSKKKQEHQEDADRRDKLIAAAEAGKLQILQRTQQKTYFRHQGKTWQTDQKNQYQRMDHELIQDLELEQVSSLETPSTQ